MRRLLDLSGSKAQAEKTIDQMFQGFQKALPNIGGEVWARLREEIDINQFVEMVVPVYVEKMSHESILAAIAFMASPDGKRFIHESNDVGLASQEIGMKWGSIVAAQVNEKLLTSGYAANTAR